MPAFRSTGNDYLRPRVEEPGPAFLVVVGSLAARAERSDLV